MTRVSSRIVVRRLVALRVAGALDCIRSPSFPSRSNEAKNTMVQSPLRSTGQAVDVLGVARENPQAQIGLLREQLERAIDALIAARLVGTSNDSDATRRVLFDLYDERVVTKAQVRERAALAPDEFHELLRAHRLRSASQPS